MKFTMVKLLTFMLAAILLSVPVISHAQSNSCSCQSWRRCGLFQRHCVDCDSGSMAEAVAGSGETFSDTPYDLGEGAPAQSGSTFAIQQNPGGYIDSAIVGSQFRMRFDAAYDNPLPDRAEFFYGQCGCFGGNAPGPPLPETRVDYQELIPYLEWAFSDRFSIFAEAPVRLINPVANQNAGGFSDLNAGFKYALVAHPDEYLTAQLRIYTPTGQPELGLGTGHISIEPSILYFRRFNDQITVKGSFAIGFQFPIQSLPTAITLRAMCCVTASDWDTTSGATPMTAARNASRR